jgi:hypothetical protein
MAMLYPNKYKRPSKTRHSGNGRYTTGVRSDKHIKIGGPEVVTGLNYILKEGKTYTPVIYDGSYLRPIDNRNEKEWSVIGPQKYKLYVSKTNYDRRMTHLKKMGVSHISRFGNF